MDPLRVPPAVPQRRAGKRSSRPHLTKAKGVQLQWGDLRRGDAMPV